MQIVHLSLHPRQELQAENEQLRLHIEGLNRLLFKERSEKNMLKKRLLVTTQRTAIVKVSAIQYHRKSSVGIIGDGPA